MDQQVLKMKSEAREKQKAQDEKRMTRKDRETQKKTKWSIKSKNISNYNLRIISTSKIQIFIDEL